MVPSGIDRSTNPRAIIIIIDFIYSKNIHIKDKNENVIVYVQNVIDTHLMVLSPLFRRALPCPPVNKAVKSSEFRGQLAI